MKPSVSAAAGKNGLVMRRPLNLENLVLVRLERVQLQLEISQVPQCYSLIGAAGCKNEFRVRIEAQAIDFSCVRVDCVTWLAGVVASKMIEKQIEINKLKLAEVHNKMYLVSQIMSFWSSATEPNKDSCNKCHATSSTTAVCPVKMVLASITRFSLGVALISQRQIVWSSEALNK